MSLRSRLQDKSILIAPGVYDGLTAAIAEDAGFEALYLSGAAIAYTRLGRPDIGLTSVSEMTDTMALIRGPRVPAGHHRRGHRLRQCPERATYDAALRTCRRECAAGRGSDIPQALRALVGQVACSGRRDGGKDRGDGRRARIRGDAGDCQDRCNRGRRVLTKPLHARRPMSQRAPTSSSSRRRDPATNCRKWSATSVTAFRCWPIWSRAEATPLQSATDLEALGYSIVIFPGGIVRALARTAGDYYASLRENGSNRPFADRMYDFDGLNEQIGTDAMLALGRRYESG